MIDYKKVKILREETGVSFSLIRKALEESNNDSEKAKKLLSLWGAEKAKAKAHKTTAQGAIFCYVHHNRKVASLLELLCETDFVASNSEFAKLGHELAMQIASMPAADIEEFIDQQYIRDPEKTVSDLLKDAILKFGENIRISRFIRWELGV